MTDNLIDKVTMRELLIFELGIYAEARAGHVLELDSQIMQELRERYNQTNAQIKEAYKNLNKKYVEVIIK